VDGWVVADDAWADDIGGILCPDWTKAFGFTSDYECFCDFRWPLISSCVADTSCVDHSKMLICSAEEKEGGSPC
jgi:hypothetical protein